MIRLPRTARGGALFFKHVESSAVDDKNADAGPAPAVDIRPMGSLG
ncbi:hypothetical protein [Hydrogenophaga sp.]|nr:hypothetical protein [Hydrogenophaga sp.]